MILRDYQSSKVDVKVITPSMVLMRLPEYSVVNIPTDGVVVDEVDDDVDHLVFDLVVTKNFLGIQQEI